MTTPRGGRRRCWATLLLLVALAPPAHAIEIRLWPLISYTHDPERDHTVLKLLGPLISYESEPERRVFILRPLLLWKRAPGPQGNEFSVLYPLSLFRWDDEISTASILGLISIESRSQDHEVGKERDRRFTLFPLVFYRSTLDEGSTLSVLPFYADLEEFLGYQRIKMILFPGYLRLEEPLGTRTWAPFPFVSWSSGPLSRGWRVWPFYGWQESGARERFEYVLWPLYIHYERPVDAEEQTTFFLFYSQVDSPRFRSRSYFTAFLHATDETSDTETWGFPWPLWVYQTRRETDQRLLLRLAPFYGELDRDNYRSRFYLWPLFRIRTTEDENYFYQRRDFLLTIGRSVEEEQFSYGRRRSLSTLFPLWRDVQVDRARTFATPALLDALIPFNETIEELYAPLWQVYASQADGDRPARWSLLWDLISSDGERLHYPIAFDWSDTDGRQQDDDDAD